MPYSLILVAASGSRINLGLVEGSFEQAYDAALSVWNALPHNRSELAELRIEGEVPFAISYITHER